MRLLFVLIPFILFANNIFDLKNNIAKVKGKFQKNTTGVILHQFNNKKIMIISRAIVFDYDGSNSLLKLIPFDDFNQKAIANTKYKVSNGDIFIPNFLYENSLIIAPNQNIFNTIRDKFIDVNFLHSDLFAVYLKVNSTPVPSKDDFIEFAKKYNIGSFYIFVNNKIYLVDGITFNIVQSFDLQIKFQNFISPFYTRVKGIEGGLFYFGDEKVKNYTNYYKKLLHLQ